MNRHWTYRNRAKSTLRREYSLFFLFNLVGLVIEVTVVFIAKYGFHQTHIAVLNLVTGLGIVLGTVFRFWAYRTHVFKADATVAAEAAIAGPAAFEKLAEPDEAAVRTVPVQATPEADADEVDEVEIELDGIVALSEEPTHTSRRR
jgi:hypothetical protein